MSRLNIDQTYRFAWGAANTNYTFIIGFKKRNSKTLTLIDCFYCLKSMTWRTIDLTFLFISIITSGLKGLNFLQNSPWLALGNHWLVKHLPQKKKNTHKQVHGYVMFHSWYSVYGFYYVKLNLVAGHLLNNKKTGSIVPVFNACSVVLRKQIFEEFIC